MEEPFRIQTEKYAPLEEGRVAAYLAKIGIVVEHLGGEPGGWNVREVGDGNLNMVFIVEGPRGGVVLKQALPYMRLVGEAWPLPLERSYFESLALIEQARAVPHLVPRIFATDRVGAAIVMEYLTPHIILRKALKEGRALPNLAEHMATFLAESLFKTSDLYLTADRKKTLMREFCGNIELCKITEDLVFTDPYRLSSGNRWTTPQLDETAAAFRADSVLKAEVQLLKLKFLTSAEALVHGDLHTGSIMVTDDDTRAIDPEFAFFGPMGFDVGALIANMLIAAVAHRVHRPGELGDAYRTWILDEAEQIWTGFDAKFRALWQTQATGDAFTAELFADADGQAALAAARDRYMARLFEDTLGFAGAKMIRRVLGLAHVEDLESIEDPDTRATAESKVLAIGRKLILNRAAITKFGEVLHMVEEIDS